MAENTRVTTAVSEDRRGPTLTAFKLPPELLADLDVAAVEANVNRSEFIRRAVRRALAEHHAEKVTQLPKRPTTSGPAQVIEFRQTQRRGAA